jgi:hypothetical protein
MLMADDRADQLPRLTPETVEPGRIHDAGRDGGSAAVAAAGDYQVQAASHIDKGPGGQRVNHRPLCVAYVCYPHQDILQHRHRTRDAGRLATHPPHKRGSPAPGPGLPSFVVLATRVAGELELLLKTTE